MTTPIIIKDAPKAYRGFLRKGDAKEGDFDGDVDTNEGASASYGAAVARNGKAASAKFLAFLEARGYKPKIEQVGKGGGKLKATPVKGYFYAFGGLTMRSKSPGSWHLFAKKNIGYAGFGVDNGDSPGKEQFQIPSKGLKSVVFDIGGPRVPSFKVEINGNELKWLPADTTGTVKLPLDQELFPQGQLNKFQIVTEPGQPNFTVSHIRVLGE